MERAIRGPAERVGVTFEQGLVEQIVSQMNYQAGALPLLQYALTELFDRREGRLLTNAAYQQIGGAVGALANRADEIYRGLTEEGQKLAHQMYMRLVTLGEGAEDTRRRATQAELLSLTDHTDLMEEVIDQFAAYRLLSLDHDPETRQPTVEVAHEAILREWDRLRQWLNESREDIRQERAVARAAEEWDQHKRDTSFLLRGTRLEQVEKWQDTTTLIQTPLEQEFVAKSLEQRAKEVELEVERAKREARLEERSRNFLRGLVAVFALATVIAGGLALFALVQRNNAIQARDAEAVALDESRRSEAEFRSIALTFGAQDALNNRQPDVALALITEAMKMDIPPLQTRDAYFKTGTSSWIRHRLIGHTSRVWDVVYSPDGEFIYTMGYDGQVIQWDADEYVQLQTFTYAGNPRLTSIAVHPDGTTLAIGTQDGVAVLWDTTSGATRQLSSPDQQWINVRDFSSDGNLVVAGSGDFPGAVIVWAVASGEIVQAMSVPEGFVLSAYFSPDDSLIVASASDGGVRVWDLDTGERLQTLVNPFGETWIFEALFLPDGERIIAGDQENMMYLWDWQAGEIIHAYEGHAAGIQDIALTSDGRLAVTGDAIGNVYLWNVELGALVRRFEGHAGRIGRLAFSPDEAHFVSGSIDQTAIVWDVMGPGSQNFIPQPEWTNYIALAPSSEVLRHIRL